MCACPLHTPYWGRCLQPRHVLWLGIEPATLWFSGRHSIHWATPAGAHPVKFWSIEVLFSSFLHLTISLMMFLFSFKYLNVVIIAVLMPLLAIPSSVSYRVYLCWLAFIVSFCHIFLILGTSHTLWLVAGPYTFYVVVECLDLAVFLLHCASFQRVVICS